MTRSSLKKTIAATVLGIAVLAAGGAAALASDAAEPATYDDIKLYCGMCHFETVENASIASWNQTNIDAAMVESMVPMLDDATVEAITAYFAAIEPPAQEEAAK